MMIIFKQEYLMRTHLAQSSFKSLTDHSRDLEMQVKFINSKTFFTFKNLFLFSEVLKNP